MKNEEVSLKNTKAEILEALQKSLEREQKLMDVKSDPIKEEKEKKTKEVVDNTKINVKNNIFSEELNHKFNELEEAIEAEEEKLSMLYGVEKELQYITVTVNASKDCLAKMQSEKELKTNELNNSIKELEDLYSQKKVDLQKEFDEKAKALKIERDREMEEYTYKQKREREKENNIWEDEKIKRENELAKKEKEIEDLLEEATNKVEYIKTLEEKVNNIPLMLEEEYKKGKNDTEKMLKIEYEHEKALNQKDNENIINRLNDKIESLNSEISKVTKQNNVLQEKLDNAYTEIKDLATKTVESASGVKIIGSENK